MDINDVLNNKRQDALFKAEKVLKEAGIYVHEEIDTEGKELIWYLDIEE